MGLMDRFARFDSTLQRGLDNGFALIFGGRVVPAEIEELIKQEAQDNLASTEDDQIFAPNIYMVGVSSKDLENLSRDQDLPARLADQTARFGRNQGWDFYGPTVVRIAEESGVHTGQLRVSSFAWSDPEHESGFDAIDHDPVDDTDNDRGPMDSQHDHQAPTTVSPTVNASRGSASDEARDREPAHPGRSVSLLLQDGSSRTYHVKEGSNIIGRSNEADFRLPDTGVSRQHAEVTWDGTDAVLVDLQSTNGTTVNDSAIENWLLADGDVITVGHSHIEVRIIDSSDR
ncbi:DUF2662 domain-containing protein [Corynebacterium yudongzhengii]|uniref:DUF2662 domain-containing protein n=1 Tax=Corynebacterium yudongzhengii TaxID=2080740 RepID=A0A2U1T537_9CORY|nr:DUF3662 and FHA domain-containing protein [Corynebacterium yudongzhengii]AWB80960.1 DUF2662 domain-containing protein [Corynebacterium yudongzhengii]PWC01114.1 DUF2662 domain-containing protein [Corynebacterium yudongzhengii]